MIFPLILTHGLGADGAHTRRSFETGTLLRLRRGCYIAAETWQRYTVWSRYEAFAEAVSRTGRRRVLTLRTAARIWGLPLEAVPEDVDVLAANHAAIRRDAPQFLRCAQAPALPEERYRSRGFGVRYRFLPPPRTVQFDGIRVSDFVDTVVQCAGYLSREDAVTVVDAALAQRAKRAATKAELLARVDAVVEPRKRNRARNVIQFASAAAESVGESVSRVAIDRLDFEPPELQVEIYDDEGLAGRSDFGWFINGQWIVGEFDGKVKYGRDAGPDGRVSVDALVREKLREDRIRATGATMVRWMWTDLTEPDRLSRLLERAGVPRKRRNGGATGPR